MPPAPAIGAAALLLLVLALAPRGALADSPTPSVSITPSATQTPQITFLPDTSLCSDNVILGSSTDYAVLAAGDALNTLGVDVIVARPDTCTKLSKSSGTLRCSPSTFQYTDPATGLVMKYVGKAGSEIPIGAATTKSGACAPTPTMTPSPSPTPTRTPTPTPSVTPSATPSPSVTPQPFSSWVATGLTLFWDQVVGKGATQYASTSWSPSNSAQPYAYVYKSTNFGATWSLVFTSPLINCGILSLGASNDGTKVIIGFACGPNPIYMTTNSGATWTQVGSGEWPMVAMAADGSAAFYSTNGGNTYKSTNNGVSFSLIYSGTPGSYISLDQGSGSVVLYPFGNPCNSIHLSTNGGSSFSTVSSISSTSGCPAFAISSSGTTVFQAVAGTIAKSTNSASSWTTVYTAPAGFSGFVWCDCSADASVAACGAADGTVVISRNSGTSWFSRSAFTASGNFGAGLSVSSDGTRIYFAQGALQGDAAPGRIYVSLAF